MSETEDLESNQNRRHFSNTDLTAVTDDSQGAKNASEKIKQMERLTAFKYPLANGKLKMGNATEKIKQMGRLLSFKHPPPKPTLSPLRMPSSNTVKILTSLKYITKTDAKTWDDIEKRFDNIIVFTDGTLPRDLFGECLGMKEESKEFAEQLFDALGRRRNLKSDSINKEELKDLWDQISNQSFNSKLQIFFDIVDKNGDGLITEEEIVEILKISASANKLSKIYEQAHEYATLIMEELDRKNLGYIKIDHLEELLLQAPVEPKKIGKKDKWSKMLSQREKPTHILDPNPNPFKMLYTSIKYLLLENWKRMWLLAVWIAVMGGLFAYKYLEYRRHTSFVVLGHCVCMAKASAETLKLNMALILLPVCRNTITWLKNKTKTGIPFDDNINFHQIIGFAVAIGVGIHTVSYLACDYPRLLNAGDDYKLLEPFFGKQPKSYWYYVKSMEGVTGVAMVVFMAIAFTLALPMFRRGNSKLPEPLKKITGFNAFWYSHHLLAIVYATLVVHGIFLSLTKEWYKKTTWMYLAIPITIYACERLTRTPRSSINKHVSIQKVRVHKNVVALQMSKPKGFEYQSGQYMFVKCLAVSPFEWHPFSITSAPEDDYLSVHIRALGDWTGKLRNVFSKVCEQYDPKCANSNPQIANFMEMEGMNTIRVPRVLIDGPYGAPAQDYKKYEVVLLVGLGIGATPMISIVGDIMNNIKAIEEEEGNLELEEGCVNPTPRRRDDFNIKKAYFYWITGEQGSFDWFEGIMDDVVEHDHNHVIELHNYCTSVYGEGDARSALISMLQSLNHAKCGVDVVSGTKVKSHFGRPKWDDVYKQIACDHPGSEVGVFYCGRPEPVKILRHLAKDFSHNTDTKFEFHKENF